MAKELSPSSTEIFQALKEAMKNDNVEMLKALIDDHKLDINYQDFSGNTLLHAAVIRDSLKITEFLVSKDADTEKKFANKE